MAEMIQVRSGTWSSLRERWGGHVLLLGPLVLYLFIFFIYPLSGVVVKSLFDPHLTSKHFLPILKFPVYVQVLLNTLEISVVATVLCIFIGYPIAYYLSGSKSNWATALLIAVILPFWISVLVRTYAWMIILGRYGVINSFLMSLGIVEAPLPLMYNRFGVYVGMVYVMLPYAILPMLSVMQGIDRTLLRASDNLGSTPWQSLWHIFLPLSLPGVGAALLLTFIRCMGFFVTPALMGSMKDSMISMSIQTQVEVLVNWGFASALSVLLLAVVLVLFFIYNRFFGLDILLGGQMKVQSKTSSSNSEAGIMARFRKGIWNENRASRFEETFWKLQDSLGGFRRLLHGLTPGFAHRMDWNRMTLGFVCLVVFFFMILPILVVVPIAFSNDVNQQFPPKSWGIGLLQSYFLSDAWMRSTKNSFLVAGQVMVLATFLGTLASLSLVRGQYRGKQLWYGLILSPIIIPVIITAFSAYFFLAKLKLIGTIPALVFAHTVLAVPYVVIVMTSTLKGFDERLEQASMSLGAGRIRTFFNVTFPLIQPGILTSALFAFIASFDELVGAMFICGVNAVTLPKQMWDGIRDEISPIITAIAALLIFLTMVLMVSVVVLRRRQERLLAQGHGMNRIKTAVETTSG